MREILPGLYHWAVEHPNLGRPVSSHYVVEPAALIDPMLPGEGLAAFDGLPPPRHVVLSCRHHDRDHARFVEAFGCSFHVNEAGMHEYEGEEVTPFAIGEEIVPGIRAAANGPIAPDDTVLRIDVDEGALLFADSLVNRAGEIAFMRDDLLGEDPAGVRADITAATSELLRRESFGHLLFAHGEPIVGSGRPALQRFVDGQQNPS
jgi:hypothetical protein